MNDTAMAAHQDFQCDVFLRHSAKDKMVVRPLAERLRRDELKVWFNEWVQKSGDSIPAMAKYKMLALVRIVGVCTMLFYRP